MKLAPLDDALNVIAASRNTAVLAAKCFQLTTSERAEDDAPVPDSHTKPRWATLQRFNIEIRGKWLERKNVSKQHKYPLPIAGGEAPQAILEVRAGLYVIHGQVSARLSKTADRRSFRKSFSNLAADSARLQARHAFGFVL